MKQKRFDDVVQERQSGHGAAGKVEHVRGAVGAAGQEIDRRPVAQAAQLVLTIAGVALLPLPATV